MASWHPATSPSSETTRLYTKVAAPPASLKNRALLFKTVLEAPELLDDPPFFPRSFSLHLPMVRTTHVIRHPRSGSPLRG